MRPGKAPSGITSNLRGFYGNARICHCVKGAWILRKMPHQALLQNRVDFPETSTSTIASKSVDFTEKNENKALLHCFTASNRVYFTGRLQQFQRLANCGRGQKCRVARKRSAEETRRSTATGLAHRLGERWVALHPLDACVCAERWPPSASPSVNTAGGQPLVSLSVSGLHLGLNHH